MKKYFITMHADDSRKPGWKPVYLVEGISNGQRDWSFTTDIKEATQYASRSAAMDARRREMASRSLTQTFSLPCEVQWV